MLRRFTRNICCSSAVPARFNTGHVSAAAAAAAATAAGPVGAGPRKDYSEAKGPVEVPVLDQLVGYYVNIQSRKMYYKDFLRIEHQAVRWAFADIRKNSEALAHGLLQTGLRPGQRVLAIQPCNCETFVLQLACAKVGALLAVVPHQNISADKLRFYLNEFQPNHFIAREWIVVPEMKQGALVERNMHFWDLIYNVIPELGLSYPGQKFQWVHSQEFFFLKKVVITDHNMNLLGVTPMRKMLVWGPFSYYEQRLRRLSALLHPDDPILALEDPNPAAEDKLHITFSHRNCVNAGFLFARLMQLKAETRFGVMPNHHTNPVGAIVAPYAALTSGAVLVHIHSDMFTDDHALNGIEKLCVEELQGILGKKADFDLLLHHTGNFDADQYEHLKWVALFEDASEPFVSDEYLQKLAKELSLDDVFVFRGPLESAYMLTWRSLKRGQCGMVPHAEAKVVGDRGTADATILSANTRGNLKLKGPHISPGYYNNAGLLTELVDERGFCSTSREAIMDEKGHLTLQRAQIY
ncbi:fatty-acyl-CoA synthase [Trypanosoma conorhini]|uniref:Fatty-acyl-CoA synthase n=1 Tax=Trypanosoma conorhini TaxID=83891 RepID=A0A3R7NV31_9TRYP|nr:fatty-acyl-CoA synthase [Trypanosoma conorhini]RNF24085.1 fatty-acyl-CoA synthase [Trypanosoma conorhini]